MSRLLFVSFVDDTVMEETTHDDEDDTVCSLLMNKLCRQVRNSAGSYVLLEGCSAKHVCHYSAIFWCYCTT